MADMSEVNGYQEYMGNMTDVTQAQHLSNSNTYNEYMNSIPNGTGSNSRVNSQAKGDSEKKDQSRYTTPQWRSIDNNGVEHY